MSDLISRQAAIDALEQGFKDTTNGIDKLSPTYGLAKAMTGIYKCYIGKLHPIQPKRGRWLYCEDTTADCVDGYRCDQCGLFVPWDYQHKSIDYIKDYNFCPNCGADMRGEQDE